jgi:hypothetical protein
MRTRRKTNRVFWIAAFVSIASLGLGLSLYESGSDRSAIATAPTKTVEAMLVANTTPVPEAAPAEDATEAVPAEFAEQISGLDVLPPAVVVPSDVTAFVERFAATHGRTPSATLLARTRILREDETQGAMYAFWTDNGKLCVFFDEGGNCTALEALAEDGVSWMIGGDPPTFRALVSDRVVSGALTVAGKSVSLDIVNNAVLAALPDPAGEVSWTLELADGTTRSGSVDTSGPKDGSVRPQ